MKSVGGRGKIIRTSSANINATNASTSKSRPSTSGWSNSINRKAHSRKAASRKSRKSAVLPCASNECPAVDADAGTAATRNSSDSDDSCEKQGVGDVDPPIKTVLSALDGGKQRARSSQNVGGDTDAAMQDARRHHERSDSQSSVNGGEGGAGGADVDSDDEGEADGTDSASASGGYGGQTPKERETRHIHPCICDLSTKAQARIKAHIRERELFEQRHAERLESIDAELRTIEDEISRRQEEEKEQKELFGDKYEMVGKKKKRLKRSARRASMVSLGVKQVINWKRSPRIKVRLNHVSDLRKNFAAYCGEGPIPLPKTKKIDIGSSPKIPVRATKAASLRSETNAKKKQFYIDNEDKRPVFVVSPFY